MGKFDAFTDTVGSSVGFNNTYIQAASVSLIFSKAVKIL
jgi:hypothetical protein